MRTKEFSKRLLSSRLGEVYIRTEGAYMTPEFTMYVTGVTRNPVYEFQFILYLQKLMASPCSNNSKNVIPIVIDSFYFERNSYNFFTIEPRGTTITE